jgi:hypothetical protein
VGEPVLCPGEEHGCHRGGLLGRGFSPKRSKRPGGRLLSWRVHLREKTTQGKGKGKGETEKGVLPTFLLQCSLAGADLTMLSSCLAGVLLWVGYRAKVELSGRAFVRERVWVKSKRVGEADAAVRKREAFTHHASPKHRSGKLKGNDDIAVRPC